MASKLTLVFSFGLALGASSCVAHEVSSKNSPLPPPCRGVACGGPASPSPPPEDHVVILAIDGVRWQEIFYGVDPVAAEVLGLPEAPAEVLLPNLHALMQEGVAFGNHRLRDGFFASGPNFVSLPGYTEILTGMPATCQENACQADLPFTLAGEATMTANSIDPSAPWSVVLASWPNIAQIARNEAAIVSCGKVLGTNRERLAIDPTLAVLLALGEGPSQFPYHPDYRADAWTAVLAREVLARVRPPLLFVSLGDTDEYAHGRDYGAYLDALARADLWLGDLRETARRLGPSHRVTFFVTTDHGRSAGFADHGRGFPESSEAWLVVGGGRVRRGGTRFLAEDRYLRDIAPTVRSILELPSRGGRPLPEVMENLLPE